MKNYTEKIKNLKLVSNYDRFCLSSESNLTEKAKENHYNDMVVTHNYLIRQGL